MEHIKKVNVPMALLLLITLKVLLLEVTFATTIFGLGLISLYAFASYIESKKQKPLDDDVKRQLEEMRNVISGVAVKNNLKSNPENKRYF